ncbi:MAG: CCA tRNA nucleotidyltransferase [Desulfobacteraceae bacterium]|nr:CCA tRNA nucleotidyltransferase [Desulfobacteraceae bacterium]
MAPVLNDGVELILERLAGNRCKAYIAGGAVRDMVSQKRPSDVDIVTNASLAEIQKIFKDQHVRTVGKSFHLCLVNGIEVATLRGRPSDFPESDLEKRDLTVNSMAWDPVTGSVIDPFSGQQDLEQGIIRFTRDGDSRILEDPLRMVRACRFVSQLKGRLAPETFDAIQRHGDLAGTRVAKERIRGEILKAMGHDRPSLFFNTLQETGLLKAVFPCLARLVDLDGGPYHGETVFEHCMIVGDSLSPRRPLLRLAGFLHDAGKFEAAVEKEGRLTFHGHEEFREEIVADLERLKFSNQEIDYIDAVIRVHMRPLTGETTPKAARRILVLLERHGVTYREFMRIRIADMGGNLAKRPYTLGDIRVRLNKLLAEIRRNGGGGFSVRDLAVSGKDVMALLNIPQGPAVGRVMNRLFDRVLDDPALNTRVELEALVLSLGPGEEPGGNGEADPG